LPMNHYAWWLVTFEIKGSDGIMLHSEQCDPCMGICLLFVSNAQQLSFPLAICPELRLVSNVFRHGVVCLEQYVFLYDTYVKYGSARKCRQKFRRKFCDERVLSRQIVHNMVNKLWVTGLLMDKKQKHKCRLLTEEKFDDIWARLEHTHRKSLKHLAQETGVSKSSARRATQLLKVRPYKRTVIHALQPLDPASRIHFCSWFLQSIFNGEIDLQLTFFCDETWFH
jgi:hypothetical protein